ncbi:hypothetical protein ABZ027_37660 [Streptomyces sp. NPDC006332]|uniref:hypothetical protein n=1 Tax=Streptomyces sp. NPDC006332 TaxID=3155456 RepID=UPI0033A6A4A8
MSEQTPSRAEGERQQEATPDNGAEETERRDVQRTTPSQAEGEDAGHADTGEDEAKEKTDQWESGWSGP